MGRPITFDKSAALDAAMDLFWRRGFTASSLSDLTAAMGISRSSFYQIFGDKQRLLDAAIDQYSERQATNCRAYLEKRTLHAGLRKMFEAIAHDNNGGRGCLLGNCAAELGPHDSMIAARVRRGISAKAHVLQSAIEAAQATGEIEQARSAHDLANYLTMAITGLRILAKTGMPSGALIKMGDVVLANLFTTPLSGRRRASKRAPQRPASAVRHSTRPIGRKAVRRD